VRALGLSFVAIGFIGILVGDNLEQFIVNRTDLILPLLLAVVLLVISRHLLVELVFKKWMRHHFRRQVAVIGSDDEAKSITDYVIHHNAPFWITGFVVGICEGKAVETCVHKEALGELNDLPEIITARGIDEIIVTDKDIDKRTLVSLLNFCTSEGLDVWFPPRLLPVIDLKLHIDTFCGLDMIRLCVRKKSYLLDIGERALDLLISFTVLLVFVPLFMAIAAAVKLSSAGPVFYRATAIGKGGKKFTLYKFRSMRTKSSCEVHKEFVTKLIKGEMRREEQKNGVLKITEDSRVTIVGHYLRKYSLDELPQIFNVLKGQMSLVGPRPCLPYEYELYKDWHKQRTVIRPGISGIWQVAGRSDVLFEDMILLDFYYIYNRSILMYMNILYETIFVVLAKRGAY
jgi:undecaprenyl-phosphate galactose phosphotransferase